MISQNAARSLLATMGWSFDEEEIKKYQSIDRVVGVYSHTSFWDATILLLFKIAYPEILGYTYTLASFGEEDSIGGQLKRIINLPVWPVATGKNFIRVQPGRGNKIVDQITKYLKAKERFVFLISPKGTKEKERWRTGYYWIAKNLDCPIAAVGLDYERRKLTVSGLIYPTDIETTERELKAKLRDIVPLYPEREDYEIRPYKPFNFIDWTDIYLFILILFIIVILIIVIQSFYL